MQNQKNTSQKPQSGSEKSSSGKKASMKSSQLMQLFEDGLKDIYWAENALLKAIPKMIKNATSEDLNQALASHLDETKEQIARLEQVFGLINVKAEGKKCDAMDGLIKEGIEIMESSEEGSMRDAGIISAAQKIEHYEIATYGTLRQFAETMNLTEVEKLLATTLQEEKEADLKLSEVAMDAINVDAAEETA
ncbi:ferritin-like domain-containing protein [Algoriphagus aestuariicola]|uniref:Ferritin-like domain-containing protein n=1 Tax=Algoriphagus aestuariicola TaxID=1852016 RepID=A0ABS3BJK6_9BACT|nr:ferritin-like domain-containing protein [Algoriphagus aestuariicola]MBN7799482.1 ferritin-like domain-containing protein [Algoriphagus aestuariicola]